MLVSLYHLLKLNYRHGNARCLALEYFCGSVGIAHPYLTDPEVKHAIEHVLAEFEHQELEKEYDGHDKEAEELEKNRVFIEKTNT